MYLLSKKIFVEYNVKELMPELKRKGIKMMKDNQIDFTKNIEKRITPEQISLVSNNAKKLIRLPKGIQDFIVNKSSNNNQYMGFVVEPYSLFLSYKIKEKDVKDLLPENYELVPVSLFSKTKPYKCAILGCFSLRTSVFWGIRYELYIIARNKKTNLMSWIICDYESNTYNYDPKNGFKSRTVEHAILTTTYNSQIICSVENKKTQNILDLVVELSGNTKEALNQTLWIEGNLSVDYAGKLGSNGKDPFGLIFNPQEMANAYQIKPKNVKIKNLKFGFLNQSLKIEEIGCFPFAQHYLTTVFPKSHKIRTVDDLYKQIDEIVKK